MANNEHLIRTHEPALSEHAGETYLRRGRWVFWIFAIIAAVYLISEHRAHVLSMDRDTLKDALRSWISNVELDPASRAGRMHYRLTLNGVKVASPRGFEPRLSP